MKALIGQIIRGVYINGDQSLLWFETTTGHIAYSVTGDCCSEAWFADIVGADCLKGEKILGVEELPMTDYNVDDGRSRQEEDEAYGYAVKTSKGTTTIVFRNSSNGYYGGWLDKYEGSRPKDLIEIVVHDWRA